MPWLIYVVESGYQSIEFLKALVRLKMPEIKVFLP